MSKKWLIIIVLVIVFIVANVATVVYTSTPSFCASCHIVTPSVDSWSVSEHNQTTCLKCHADPGMIGYMKAKLGGVMEMYIWYTQDVTREDLENKNVHVNPDSCLKCHKDIKEDGTHLLHASMLGNCVTCHQGVGHGVETQSCGDCHEGM